MCVFLRCVYLHPTVFNQLWWVWGYSRSQPRDSLMCTKFKATDPWPPSNTRGGLPFTWPAFFWNELVKHKHTPSVTWRKTPESLKGCWGGALEKKQQENFFREQGVKSTQAQDYAVTCYWWGVGDSCPVILTVYFLCWWDMSVSQHIHGGQVITLRSYFLPATEWVWDQTQVVRLPGHLSPEQSCLS